MKVEITWPAVHSWQPKKLPCMVLDQTENPANVYLLYHIAPNAVAHIVNLNPRVGSNVHRKVPLANIFPFKGKVVMEYEDE